MLVLDDAGDEAPFRRTLGRNALAQHHHLHRPRAAGEAGKEPSRARVRDQADVDERLEKYAEVPAITMSRRARGCRHAPAAGAVHRRNHREWQTRTRFDSGLKCFSSARRIVRGRRR
jgi:hypothetical protein